MFQLLTWYNISFFLLFVFVISTLLTWFVYRHAGRLGLLAIPNERSSHTVPTPSGGGLAIAIIFFGAVAFLGLFDILDKQIMWALLGGGLMIAVVGFIDVLRPLKARVRVFVHSIAAIWALWFIGGVFSVDLGFTVLYLGMWGNIIAFLSIVAFSNLYNFMDGIDGLIGMETVVVGGVVGLLLVFSGVPELAFISWALAASAAGFLIWNWHPAKIFMGDVGSVLIGFSFVILAIVSERAGALPGLVWVLLLAIVIIDAGLSTLRRAIKKERWYEAHRTFGYHCLVKRGYTHSQAVLQILTLNIVLALAGVFLWKYPVYILPVIIVSFVMLGWTWWHVQKSIAEHVQT